MDYVKICETCGMPKLSYHACDLRVVSRCDQSSSESTLHLTVSSNTPLNLAKRGTEEDDNHVCDLSIEKHFLDLSIWLIYCAFCLYMENVLRFFFSIFVSNL